MIPTQLLIDLGYKGAVIILSDDWRSNRHIKLSDNKSLCGRYITPQGKAYDKNGRFIAYKPGSYTDVYGFYGSGRCKQCLTKYLRHRLSERGQSMIAKANALRLVADWRRNAAVQQFREAHRARLAAKEAQLQRARTLLGLPAR